MRREHLAGLSAFAAVAVHRSFSSAAAQLGLSASAVSHAVRELEARLGLRLLNRSTRSVALTEAGERYLARVAPALEQLAAAADDLDDLQHTPSGTLRINVSRPAYWAVLASRIAAFRQAYPHLTFELVIDDVLADIVASGCDAGIRLGETLQQDMVAVPVSAPLQMVVCAAPAYFARHPRPTTPADLAQHRVHRVSIPGQRDHLRLGTRARRSSDEVRAERAAHSERRNDPAGSREIRGRSGLPDVRHRQRRSRRGFVGASAERLVPTVSRIFSIPPEPSAGARQTACSDRSSARVTAALQQLRRIELSWLVPTETHEHPHTHERLAYEHEHVHDEHHRHDHSKDEGPEPHTHRHKHQPLTHSHATSAGSASSS